MNWQISWRADPVGAALADKHYNRQKIGAKQFVPPGSCFVLRTPSGDAVWVTSVPLAEYVKHAWAGAWMNSLFRREPTAPLASLLIREAVAATRWHYGDPPPLGMVTFIDTGKVRRKRDFGRCYLRAGFKPVGYTKDEGLLAMQLLPADMPAAAPPCASQFHFPIGEVEHGPA